MRRSRATLIKCVLLIWFICFIWPIITRYFIENRESQHDILQRNVLEHEDESLEMTEEKKRLSGGAFKDKTRLQTDKKESEMQNVEKRTEDKIDWHDYDKIKLYSQRTGPGEQGAAVILSAAEELMKHELLKSNGFNALVSDKISLDRALKDIRHPGCRTQKYLAKLPKASIVVPFHNEHWTTLLRTVQSVLNMSPHSLIHEIILVDDFSTKSFSRGPLEDYLKQHYNGKVRVYHTDKREGLIRTRLIGAKHATGEVLIFLDSHVEANINWLPPLLEPIAKNRKTVVCPFIDVIDADTFAYRAQDNGARGAFDWQFLYKRIPLLPEDLKHPTEPFNSPVMAGGLFAIERQWFWDLGGYDPGLEIWGGDQYELSFKIWQCGGKMVDAPCSRVGHIYRKFMPFSNPGKGDFIGKNHKRVAEVWMDEYKEYYYMRQPHLRKVDPGNLTAQYAVRKKHNCKSFKWFMENVLFDLQKYFPFIEPENVAEGELRNIGMNLCVDTKFKGSSEIFGLESCMKDRNNIAGEQRFELTWHKDLRPFKRSVCFDVSVGQSRAPVVLYHCHGMKGNQYFKYNIDTQQLYHPVRQQCLDGNAERKELYMNPCESDNQNQKWKFEKINRNLAIKEWNSQKDY